MVALSDAIRELAVWQPMRILREYLLVILAQQIGSATSCMSFHLHVL